MPHPYTHLFFFTLCNLRESSSKVRSKLQSDTFLWQPKFRHMHCCCLPFGSWDRFAGPELLHKLHFELFPPPGIPFLVFCSGTCPRHLYQSESHVHLHRVVLLTFPQLLHLRLEKQSTMRPGEDSHNLATLKLNQQWQPPLWRGALHTTAGTHFNTRSIVDAGRALCQHLRYVSGTDTESVRYVCTHGSAHNNRNTMC